MRIETSVVINRPIEEVWAFMADMFNVPRYGVSALGLRKTSPGPIGVGTTVQSRVVILGFETRLSAVLTEWNPPRAYALSGSGGGMRSFSLRETHEATAEGTKIVRAVEFEPGPAFKPFWWVLASWFRHRSEAATQNIKRLLEAGPG